MQPAARTTAALFAEKLDSAYFMVRKDTDFDAQYADIPADL